MLLVVGSIGDGIWDADGKSISMWDVGTTANMIVVVAATFRILMEAKEWQWVFGASIGLSAFAWWIWVHLLAEGKMLKFITDLATPEIGGQTKNMPSQSPFWLVSVLSVTIFILCYVAAAVSPARSLYVCCFRRLCSDDAPTFACVLPRAIRRTRPSSNPNHSKSSASRST
jgi:hypothetical protein